MVFNSLTFVVFFAIVLGLHSLPFSWTVKKTNLLLASYIFYAAWSPPFVVLLWITTLVDFFVAKLIFRTEKKSKRRLLFLISLAEPRELRRRPGQADTARDGKVVLVCFPMGGKIWEINERAYPKKEYWDFLASHASGVHGSISRLIPRCLATICRTGHTWIPTADRSSQKV
jgi:hypothetical protein